MTKSSTDKETDQGYCKLWKGCGGVEEAEAKEVHWMQVMHGGGTQGWLLQSPRRQR